MISEYVVLVDGNYQREDLTQIRNRMDLYPHDILANGLPDTEWLAMNIEGRYMGVFYDPPRWTVFYFEQAEDAFLFKMKYF